MNKMTIRLSNLTTEHLTQWLEFIQLYPDNVTYWDAQKQSKPVLRKSRWYDGVVMVETEVEEEVDTEDYEEVEVEEPVIEDQDVVVRFTDPDESPEPATTGWLDISAYDTSATQPNDPSM